MEHYVFISLVEPLTAHPPLVYSPLVSAPNTQKNMLPEPPPNGHTYQDLEEFLSR